MLLKLVNRLFPRTLAQKLRHAVRTFNAVRAFPMRFHLFIFAVACLNMCVSVAVFLTMAAAVGMRLPVLLGTWTRAPQVLLSLRAAPLLLLSLRGSLGCFVNRSACEDSSQPSELGRAAAVKGESLR